MDASELIFISSGMSGAGELHDSNLLEDGMHREFARVIPIVFE
jgi:hypothetical protein